MLQTCQSTHEQHSHSSLLIKALRVLENSIIEVCTQTNLTELHYTVHCRQSPLLQPVIINAIFISGLQCISFIQNEYECLNILQW